MKREDDLDTTIKKRILAAGWAHLCSPHPLGDQAGGEAQHQCQPVSHGAVGQPEVAPELPNVEGHLPGALHLAHPHPLETGHPPGACHPPVEVGHHRPLEAHHLNSCRSIRNQFGMGRSTVRAVLMQVVTAINSVLLQRVIHLALCQQYSLV